MCLQVKEMRQSIQTQICRCRNLCAFEQLPGMQGDRRVIVEEKWYELPDTASGGIAIFWFALARIILFRSTTKGLFGLGYSIS